MKKKDTIGMWQLNFPENKGKQEQEQAVDPLFYP